MESKTINNINHPQLKTRKIQYKTLAILTGFQKCLGVGFTITKQLTQEK